MIFVKIAAVLEDCPVPNTVSFFFFFNKGNQARSQEFSEVKFVLVLGYCWEEKKSENSTK